MKKRNDIILIAALIILSALAYLLISLIGKEGAYVSVSIDGNEVERYSLSEDITVTIGDEDNYNVLVIKDGYAVITEASCPDKLCVRQHSINKNSESIICLPNKLVIEVIGGEDSDVDTSVH